MGQACLSMTHIGWICSLFLYLRAGHGPNFLAQKWNVLCSNVCLKALADQTYLERRNVYIKQMTFRAIGWTRAWILGTSLNGLGEDKLQLGQAQPMNTSRFKRMALIEEILQEHYSFSLFNSSITRSLIGAQGLIKMYWQRKITKPRNSCTCLYLGRIQGLGNVTRKTVV